MEFDSQLLRNAAPTEKVYGLSCSSIRNYTEVIGGSRPKGVTTRDRGDRYAEIPKVFCSEANNRLRVLACQ